MTSLPLTLRASLERRLLRHVRADEGFTLIEAVLGMVLFVIVATSLAGVITSSIASNSLARERTIAEQKSQEKIESIRRMDYDDVGLPSGNPPGIVTSPDSLNAQGLKATITTQVQWVDDPTPTSYATSANYKRVTVTVTRNRDGKVMSRAVTNIAPPGRAPFGGINNAIVNVTVSDMGLNQPADNATVNLTLGPSAPLSDITGATGLVTFPSLTPSPPTYRIDVTKPGGYVTLSDDVYPSAAASADLAPTQTFDTTIRIYKPATIQVYLQNPDTTPYTLPATVKVFSAFRNAWTTFALTALDGGAKTITALGTPSEPVIPGQQYTIRGYTPTGLCAQANPEYVPAPGDYPAIMTRSFTLVMTPCPSGNMLVNVQQLGTNAAGATVTVTGGPNDVNLSGTTDAAGDVTFSNLPSGSGYNVAATRCSQNASTTATVTTGVTTPVAITLPNPPTATVVATARWAGLAAASAAIGLSGGPCGITVAPTVADANGRVTFSNVPTGSGYTATATKNTGSGSQGFTVAGSPTNVTVNVLPTKVMTFTIQRNGSTPAGANLPVTIGLTGGPNGLAGANPVYQVSGTTNGSSQIQLTVPAATGYTYTIKAYMTGCPTTPAPSPSYRSRSGTTVNAAVGTTTATVNLTSSTCPLTLP
jgi:type II secretory pathway pseudopilin PulG